MSYGHSSSGQHPYGQQPGGPNPYGQQPWGPPGQPWNQPPQGQPQPGHQVPPQPGALGQPHPAPGQPWQQPGPPWGAPGPGPQGPGPQVGQWGAPDQPVPATPVPEPEPRRAVFRHRDLPVTTTDMLPGRTIDEVVGEVIGVVTRARDMRASADLSAVLTTTRQEAVDALVAMAIEAHADAVVGLRFDGGKVNDGTSEVAAYGTAVRLQPLPDEPNPFTTAANPLEGSDPLPSDGVDL